MEHDRSSIERTVASIIAAYLRAQGVKRVYGLCGGHIQPIWDEVARANMEVVDVRHEAAAVYMAHADADLSGQVGVALVTAGPGLTNALTAIANAHTSRSPILVISGRPPRPQAGMGAMQDLPQSDMTSPICRRTETVAAARHVLPRLHSTWQAALGAQGPTGPAYIDFPTDLLTEPAHPADVDERYFVPYHSPQLHPAAASVEHAVRLLHTAERPALISGRATLTARHELRAFLEATGALHLETGESRGALPAGHPSAVPAMRARVMREADLVITADRRLDFQLGYGSPAVFSPDARFLRLGRSAEALHDNRRADAEVQGDLAAVFADLTAAFPAQPPRLDQTWVDEIRATNADRAAGLERKMRDQPPGNDGHMHPYRLISAVNEFLQAEGSVAIADGGDILSFARVGLTGSRYLDCGPLGCLGVGIPFAVSAALSHPNQSVIAIIGDGSFGFTAMEIDTAVRHHASAVFVVANNQAWNIERHDQVHRFEGNTVGVDLPGCRYDLLARSLGAHGEHVEQPDELAPALQRAQVYAPAVVDVTVTRDVTSPDFANGIAGVPTRHALQPWHDAEAQRYQ